MTTPRLSADTRDTRLLASLEDCEQKIKSAFRRGLEATCSIATELGKILAGELYLQRGYDTFGEYVTDHLGIAGATMRRIISISETVDLLKKAGLALPMNETQAAELARLEPEDRPKFWSELLSEAERHEHVLTTESIKEAIDQLETPTPTRRTVTTTTTTRTVEIDMDDEGENGDQPNEKPVEGSVVGAAAVILSEKGEAALARIQKLCGEETARIILSGNLPISERALCLWADQEDALVKALNMYVIYEGWTVTRAIDFETRELEPSTPAKTMLTIAQAHGGRATLYFAGAKITVELIKAGN